MKFDIEQARKLRNSGLTYTEIGQIFGLHKGTVRRKLDASAMNYSAVQHAKYRQTARGKAYAALLRSRAYAKKYGYEPCNLTAEQLRERYTDHCEICTTKEIECKTRLCLDHDHKTGNFRGWICNDCNVLLGRAKDNPNILRSAADYLDKSQCQPG